MPSLGYQWGRYRFGPPIGSIPEVAPPSPETPSAAAGAAQVLSIYPASLDVFMTLIDGLHPIGAQDLNALHQALEHIEQTLGYGLTDGPTFGPKGGNTDVRERLDTFLEDYGGLVDVAFVTGTARIGTFAEAGTGLFIGFGKTLSSQNFTCVFTALQAEKEGNDFANKTPAIVWIAANGRLPTGVWLQARTADGNPISSTDETTVTFGLLAFGPKATY